jgi:hypothetical protein
MATVREFCWVQPYRIDTQGRSPPGIDCTTCGFMVDLLGSSVKLKKYDNQISMLVEIYLLLLPWHDSHMIASWIHDREFIDPTLISYRNQPARKEDVLRKRKASPMANVKYNNLDEIQGQL